jgi:hypothetical protein
MEKSCRVLAIGWRINREDPTFQSPDYQPSWPIVSNSQLGGLRLLKGLFHLSHYEVLKGILGMK